MNYAQNKFISFLISTSIILRLEEIKIFLQAYINIQFLRSESLQLIVVQLLILIMYIISRRSVLAGVTFLRICIILSQSKILSSHWSLGCYKGLYDFAISFCIYALSIAKPIILMSSAKLKYKFLCGNAERSWYTTYLSNFLEFMTNPHIYPIIIYKTCGVTVKYIFVIEIELFIYCSIVRRFGMCMDWWLDDLRHKNYDDYRKNK